MNRYVHIVAETVLATLLCVSFQLIPTFILFRRNLETNPSWQILAYGALVNAVFIFIPLLVFNLFKSNKKI